MDTLTKYLIAFGKLKRGVTKYGKAPHKVVLLLSVLQGYRLGQIKDNVISISPELVLQYRTNWNALVNTQHVCNFALPFWHLKGEGFWQLVPKTGFAALMQLKESVSSLGELNAVVDYAVLDVDLYELMKDERSNLVLHQFLLDTYFADTKERFNGSTGGQQDLFNDIEGKILHEDPTQYQQEIKMLMQAQNEVEIFLRGSLFKREIPKIYNNTCCISGMRVESTTAVSMIDACHIVPFSESFDDTITNGIALCPNLHRAFDRGLIGIDENYKVVVSNSFKEDETSYSIGAFEGKEIQLPKMKSYYPLKRNFEWHRNNIFK